MPRNLNPGTLKIGHGKSAPDANALRPSLTGAGLPGPGPNIGQSVVPPGTPPGIASLADHLQAPLGAHNAAAIEHDGSPDILISGTVEGALDELIGTVVKRPPYLGQWSLTTEFSGIPDWGFLKLRDASLNNYVLTGGTPPLANMPVGADPADVFPYYFTAPGPAQDQEFTRRIYNEGEDPATDFVWNTGLEVLAEPGMGYGRCHIGGFTRGGDVGPAPKNVMRTARLYPRSNLVDAETGRPPREPVTCSGTIFPADRGVLALFHFPASNRGDMQLEFLGQPLVTDETDPVAAQGRVVAALLLGAGILGEKCGVGSCDGPSCDGGVGGIFGKGTDSVTDKYQPFAYPGRASGQYDLKEIHTGVDSIAGNELRAPWNDLNGDTVLGSKRTAFDLIPAPGQVRLGTDPDAGATPVSYGIPILGGTADYFTVVPVPQLGSLGLPIQGDSIIGDSNFFRYRLPVLKDYSNTGLKWTPRGEDPYLTPETARYFEKAAPLATAYADGVVVGTELRTAGLYEAGFDEDYWVWQVARYRHTFLMPSLQGMNLREEVGSYWLVHFKTEQDFEKFAQEGIFPWDVTDGYEVYGYTLAGAPPVHIEEDKNIVNEWPAATDPVSPDGPAPGFGYAANPYHGLRSTIFLDPVGASLPAVTTSTYAWTTTSVPGAATEAIVWVSGVAYFTPHRAADGATAYEFTNIDLVLNPGFWTSYRTDSDDLSVNDTVAPAILASVNPLFLNMAPWAYGGGSGGSPLSLTVPTGVPGPGTIIPGVRFLGRHRIEVPFEYLGSNAGGTFDDANGPLDADTLVLDFAGRMTAQGDYTEPSFTRDATMRAYLRRPLNHLVDDTTTLPFTAADGHGQVLTPVGGLRVLFHSTGFDKTLTLGDYGNYVVAAVGAPPNTSYITLVSSEKAIRETFLDETYRLIPNFTAAATAGLAVVGTPYTVAAFDSLVGPGMQGWVGGPIEVPVHVSLATDPWDSASWLLMEKHLEDLSAADPDVGDGLQVVGLPDRNPAQSAAVQMPFPSRGMLVYPQEDFFTAVAPVGALHFTGVQPDYSGVPGAGGERQYVRAFDTAFKDSLVPVAAAGTSTAVLRIDGLTLADLAYSAPGPGGLPIDRVSIQVKVPGLTTWMDIGRQDGAGPSKQDMFVDGAGCQVAGPETYTFEDPTSGYVGCYVKVHVGPMATLAPNMGLWSSYSVGSPAGEVPLMVKVVMADGSVDYNLEHRFVGGVFEVAVKPGAEPNLVRGIIGINLVHPNDILIP